jgi:capsular polysaccharide biosynthesis protein
MELRQYWNVIKKRGWLVLAIVGLTAVISGYMYATTKLTYEGEVRFITRQEPTADNSQYVVFTFDRYYNWFGSEFLVDDYTQIVESDAFARSVLALLESRNKATVLGKARGVYTTADMKAALVADRRHRELRVMVTATSAEEVEEIGKDVATVLTDAKLKPIKGEMVDDKPVFSQIDEATLDDIHSSKSKELINAAIKVAIALVAALALVFLLEYLDGSVRDERDAQKVLDLPVIGSIPRS